MTTTTHRLLAASATAALVGGGLFLTGSPAMAAPGAGTCTAAQASFTTALTNAGVTSEHTAQLATALQAVLTAQTEGAALLAAAIENTPPAGAAWEAAKADLVKASAALLTAQAAAAAAEPALVAAQANLATALTAQTNAAAAAANATAELSTADAAAKAAAAAVVTAQANYDALPAVPEAPKAAALQELKAAIAASATAQANLATAQEAVTVAAAALVAADTAVAAARVPLDPAVPGSPAAVAAAAALNLLAAQQAETAAAANVVTTGAAYVAAQNAPAIAAVVAKVQQAMAAVDALNAGMGNLRIDTAELHRLFEASIAACSGTGAGTVVTGTVADTGAVGAVVKESNVVTGRQGAAAPVAANKGMNVQTAARASADEPANIFALGGLLAVGLSVPVLVAVGMRRKAKDNG